MYVRIIFHQNLINALPDYCIYIYMCCYIVSAGGGTLVSLSALAWLEANTEQAWHSLSPSAPSNWEGGEGGRVVRVYECDREGVRMQ